MDLHISIYSDQIREYLTKLIRLIGKKAQKPLWGRIFENCSDSQSILYLDSGGEIYDLRTVSKTIGASYREHIIFKKDGRKIHIISDLSHMPGDDDADINLHEIVKRCSVLDEEMRCAQFCVVDPDFMHTRQHYSEICRQIKDAVKKGICYERMNKSLIKREWMDEVDVFVTDEFSENAVLIGTAEENDPIVIHIGGPENEIFAPFSSVMLSCFMPNDKAYREMLYAVSLWLLDAGVKSQAEHLKTAVNNFESLDKVFEEMEKPLRERSKRDGKQNQA